MPKRPLKAVSSRPSLRSSRFRLLRLPAMADANTLGKFELNTRLAGSRNSLNLEDLKLGLDDTAFSGRFGIADFARQSLRAQLKGDKLDLDRYL
ncbi:AsmA family protein, partial [Pseudomonas aeruginosa]